MAGVRKIVRGLWPLGYDLAAYKAFRLLRTLSPALCARLLIRSLVAGLLPVALLVVSAEVLDHLTVHAASTRTGIGELEVLAFALLGMYGFSLAVGAYSEAFSRRVSRYVDASLRGRVIDLCLGPTGIAHLESETIRSAIDAAKGATTARWNPGVAIEALGNVVSQQIRRLATLILLGLIDVRYFLLAAIAGFASRRVMFPVLLRVLQRGRTLNSFQRAEYFRDVVVHDAAAKEVRVFGLHDWIDTRYRNALSAAVGGAQQQRRNYDLKARLLIVISTVGYFFALLLAARSIVAGSQPPGVLLMVSGAFGLLAPQLFLDDARIASGVKDLDTIDTAEQLAGVAPQPSQQRHSVNSVPTHLGPIQFESVQFRYPANMTPTLEGLALAIEPGRTTALVGTNGAGKTTIVKLLLRLYEPDQGRITIGDTDLSTLSATEWRSRVAVVFQDFLRFPWTLRDNVFPQQHSAPGGQAGGSRPPYGGLDAVVARLARGWDSSLAPWSKEGTNLSGGQWQRVALARALARVSAGAQLLILDEPASQLDVRAEIELHANLRELADVATNTGEKPTILLITHRLSAVRRADHICVLDGGRVVESGTHDELIALAGTYEQMYSAQASAFAEE